MSLTATNPHRLLDALRKHGALVLIGMSEEEGYFVPVKDQSAIPQEAMLQAGAVILMDGSKPARDTFQHLTGAGGKVSTSLIFMAGADQLKSIEEFKATLEEKNDKLSYRVMHGTGSISEEGLSPNLLKAELGSEKSG